jgi:hypothetical protein
MARTVKWIVLAASPFVAAGLIVAFLKIRFALVKDEAERLELMRKWFGDE